MSVIKTDSNQLLRELWHIFMLQYMFQGDALAYSMDLIIEFIASANDIKNVNYELGHLLEDMYFATPTKSPTIAELLRACEDKGIIIKEVQNG